MQRIWVVIRRHNMISLHFPPLMFSLCSQPHSFCLAPLCHPVLMENSQTVKLCPPSALVDRKALVIMDWSYDGNGGGGVETYLISKYLSHLLLLLRCRELDREPPLRSSVPVFLGLEQLFEFIVIYINWRYLIRWPDPFTRRGTSVATDMDVIDLVKRQSY